MNGLPTVELRESGFLYSVVVGTFCPKLTLCGVFCDHSDSILFTGITHINIYRLVH